jgi:hypothetical protein
VILPATDGDTSPRLTGKQPAMSRKRRRNIPEKPAAASVRPARSIITPAIDFLCCGGLSIIGIGVYLLYRLTIGAGSTAPFDLGEVTVVAALVNWPHFMASYSLLYSSRLQITRHKWASLAVPGVLVGLMLFAVATPAGQQSGRLLINETIGLGLMLLAHFYLAWHYTGQAWGMVAAFAYVDGVRIDETERRMIRAGLRLLLVWHLVWASQDIGEYYAIAVPFDTIFQILGVIGFGTFIFGLLGFRRLRERTGRSPSWRMVSPWLAIWLWYALIYIEPAAFFWVQISHALQYLIFPIRVELNRHMADRSAALHALRAVAYYAVLVAIGMVVFYLPQNLLPHGHPDNNLAGLIAASVNIHHYFVDGVIWKIRNPEVQRDLFAHLAAET